MKNSFLNRTLKGTKFYIVLILILSAIYSRLLVYIPMFIQYALDGVIMENESVIPNLIRNLFYSNDKISKIIVLVLVLIMLNILVFIVNYLKSKINTKFNLIINRNVKESVLEHIPKINYMQFSNIDKSNVIQRVNNDATIYSEFFNSQINLFFDTIFIIIFAVAQTLQLNSNVGLFIAIICGLIVALSIWYFRASKPLVEEIVESNREVTKMLKIFNRRDKEMEDFSKMNREYKKKEIKLAKMKVLYGIGTHTLRNFKEPFILLWGGIKVVTMIGSNLANKASINKEQEEQEKVIKPNPDDVMPGMNITYEADKYAVDAKDVQAMANDTYKGEGKYVFLTFDDGPSPNTEKILDILKEKDVKATLFVLS